VITIFGFGKRNDKLRPPDNKKHKKIQPSEEADKAEESDGGVSIPPEIDKCANLLKDIFFNSSDVVIDIFETKKEKAMIVYINGMINKDITGRDIITPLKSPDFNGDAAFAIKAQYKTLHDMTAVASEIVNGNVAVFYENSGRVFAVDFRQWDMRPVETPESETVTRGPKEGFTENILTNTSLIRRKIRNPGLIFENMILGRQTHTQVLLVYINAIVNRNVLKELKARLSKIDVGSVLESGYIEQYIGHHTFSPVSGFGITQKPDILAARILEGRVGILCDGTPHVLTVPELFIENIQSSEDYYDRTLQALFFRLLRVIGIFIGTLIPGLSVAFMTYNQETIPPPFMTHLINSTQKTPLPIAAEAFFLILMFELLRESGKRMPKTIGSAITIVGSLIIGEAAVNAGIVGAPMVIIIAMTAVSSFIVPNLAEFILVYRLFFLMLGAMMGLIGIGTGVVFMLAQLISTESFGIPILSSFSGSEMKDGVVRFPLWTMKKRPESITNENVRRMK
jgi:spore germination protein KA